MAEVLGKSRQGTPCEPSTARPRRTDDCRDRCSPRPIVTDDVRRDPLPLTVAQDKTNTQRCPLNGGNLESRPIENRNPKSPQLLGDPRLPDERSLAHQSGPAHPRRLRAQAERRGGQTGRRARYGASGKTVPPDRFPTPPAVATGLTGQSRYGHSRNPTDHRRQRVNLLWQFPQIWQKMEKSGKSWTSVATSCSPHTTRLRRLFLVLERS